MPYTPTWQVSRVSRRPPFYDDVTVTDPGQLDVDHWIPLEQMARSGTRGWTPAQRQAYANDPTVLIAVTAKSNRQKGSQDPARWLPVHRCEYVQAWVAIKARYQVTIDQAEHDAIASVLRRCGPAR
ncbi:DUF1524 domain-containing protein [Amycolatopsis sp. lyj-108]|uniref:GmrSD restriction endonuclease domain-containing protein n=1 Tax=Amycolatopsis sp. lyj-108 TaxID=2789286 RepID=UPI003979D703